MKKAKQIKIEEYPKNTEMIVHEKKESVRLNKYLSSSGYCSRREADRYIEEGSVYVDGQVAEMGTKVIVGQEISVHDEVISQKEGFVYLILHKPVGIISTTDIEIKDNMVTYMNYPQRIFPVGRLDRESSGLIILTNDGDVVNKILRSKNEHEKEYRVKVDQPINKEFMDGLRKGVRIYNPVTNSYQMTKPCKVIQKSGTIFHIILSEGLNRQIRRMCNVFDYKIYELKRIRIMNITIEELEVGEWRYLSQEEISSLNKQLQQD